ncbi:MAG: fused MFS/spermidine synthase [Vicinamibacterales bacterium]
MGALAPYLILFFISGASGLAFEVVWTRLLGLAIGHTTVALTAVVAAYMGGLAAGSAYFGRRLRRGMNAVRLYVALEAGVAVLALAFPLQLSLVTWLSAASGDLFVRGSLALGLVRFLLAAVAVVPATFLMGGTLPAMLDVVPGAQGNRGSVRAASLLYACNTAGAVAGAALAGFVLIERLGTYETTWLGAAGNAAVALLLILLRPQSQQVAGEAASGTEAPDDGWQYVAVAYGLAGFAALTCQIVWTRALVFFAGSTTYAFTSMLVVFLTGITVGSALAAPRIERLRDVRRAFLATQVAIGVTAAWSLPMLQWLTPAIDGRWNPERSWASLVAGGFLKALVTMGAPTLLMGGLFPLAVRLATTGRTGPGESLRASGSLLGRLYAWNTLGGIGGAAVSGLVLLPLLGIRHTLLLACAVSLAGALVVWRQTGRSRVELGAMAAAVVLMAVPTLRGAPLHVPGGSEQLVFYEEGASGTVSVLQEVTGTRTIYIDRVPVAGTDTIMLTDQKSLAHVPMLLNPSATRVLTVGFGSGGASWSFTRWSSLAQVDAVEIDPTVFRAAPHLQDSNHGVWSDTRFHLVLEDARNYLASTDLRYDVISTDCTDLRYKTNANLYTVDYFTLVRNRLNPGGIVTVWMPLGGLGGDTFRMALRTFRAVFPHTTIWYMTNQPTHYLLLVGTDHEIRPDVAEMGRHLGAEPVRADLAEIRLADPLKVASSLVLDERDAARVAGEGPLNTDRHPLLEFEAPRLAYRDALATNLRAIAAARDWSADLSRWRTTADAAPALERYVASTPALIEGHARYQMGTFDYAGALRLYRSAATLNPADASIPALIADVEHTRDVWLSEFSARTTGGSNDVRDWLAHATLLRQAGQLDAAAAAARRATDIDPSSSDAWLRLAAIQSQRGAPAEAVATLERARQVQGDDPMLLADLGAAFNDEGRFADAETVLRRSLSLRETADAHNNLGVALNGLDRPSDAVRAFGAALARNPSSAEAWFNLGVAQALLGDVEQARTAYQRGLSLMPGEPRALANLAMVEAQAGRLDLTVRYLSDAIAADYATAEVYNNLGRAYLGLRRADEAVAALEQALRLDPTSVAVKENLALARAAQSAAPVR